MIEVKILKDSISEWGNRLTTFQLKYPRFIHSEMLTHRVFSRSSGSSRAIPVSRMIKDINEDWARPIYFNKNVSGMQGGEILKNEELFKVWEQAKNSAISHAKELLDLGAHKQQANRILEPFAYISVVLSSTEYDNFFELRCHPDAQPEIQLVAELMRSELQGSAPKVCKEGDWHLPYIDDDSDLPLDIKRKISVARCARVSYNKHDGSSSTIDEDVKLFERLVGSRPLHASPAEHQARPAETPIRYYGNFKGWLQYRKLLEMGR